jgi:hypothetical protein
MVKGVLVNVRGLYDTAQHKDKWGKIRFLMQQTGADFAVLTETHVHKEDEPWGMGDAAISYAPYKGSFKGVAVLPLNQRCTVKKVWEAGGRAIKCDISLTGEPVLRLGAVYAPATASGRATFFNNMRSHMSDVDAMLGDFNCTLAQEDKTGVWRASASSAALRSLLEFLELEDSQPHGAEHTWFGAGRDCSARLDRVYFDPTKLCGAVDRLAPSLSDHRMVCFSLSSLEPIAASRTPIWRAKQEWFDSPTLCSRVSRVASNYSHLAGAELVKKWDTIKIDVKRAVIRHRLEEAKEAQLWGGEGAVVKELTRVSPASASLSPTGMDTLDNMITKRRAMYTRMKDSRRELPDAALSALIKKEKSDQTFRGLKASKSSAVTTSLKDMRSIMHSHYEERFSKQEVELDRLINFVTPLPERAIRDLNLEFSTNDLAEFIKKTKPNSAPGIDGLPYRVYLRSVPLLRLLRKLLQAVMDTGLVPQTWREAVIRCIPKEGKDLTLPDSYRPISLCCTDFKTFMGILADRFQDIFSFRHSQTGYLRNRSPHLAALRVADHFARFPSQKPVLLDYDKAYDRVSHEWIEAVLTRTGLPSNLTRVILACLSGMSSQILVNNTLTEKFVHGSGVRQGDPFAPLLFLLCIDPLLEKLNRENIFHHAHCDDLIIGVNKLNIDRAIKSLEDYDRATGAKVNFTKTSLITNCAKLPFQHPFETKKGDRYLGLWLTPKGNLRTMPNLLEDIETKMRKWKKFHLSWAGRETILNSYLRPWYLYQITVVNTPLSDFATLEKWFLSASNDDPWGKGFRYPLSIDKMRSRVSRLRLRPLEDALRDRRATLLLRLSRSDKEYFTGSRESQFLSGPSTPHPLHIFKSLHERLPNTKNRDIKTTVKEYKERVAREEAKEPKWSEGQIYFSKVYKTNWSNLFRHLRKMKVRAAITSFAWKLANRKIHITTDEERCPFCEEQLTTRHILNGACKSLEVPKGQYDAFFTPPYADEFDIITIWSIWKAWCHFTHTPNTNPKPSLVRHLFEGFYSVESGRLL